MKLNHLETHVSADYLLQIYLMINFLISYNIYLFLLYRWEKNLQRTFCNYWKSGRSYANSTMLVTQKEKLHYGQGTQEERSKWILKLMIDLMVNLKYPRQLIYGIVITGKHNLYLQVINIISVNFWLFFFFSK